MDWLLAGLTLKDRIRALDSSARDSKIPNLKVLHLSTLGTFPFLRCSFLGLDTNLSFVAVHWERRAALSLTQVLFNPFSKAERKV